MSRFETRELFSFSKTTEPGSLEELSGVLTEARREKLGVIPWGSGSHQTMGHYPERCELKVSFRKLSRVREHAEKDLTVTVEAGITLDELRRFLEPRGQFFPYWTPGTGKRTLGGILSTASYNFLSPQYGHPRDLVLGMSVCHPDGTSTKSGGKVVKNVSGYEMPKLYIGSFGAMGCIAACTLRLAPLAGRPGLLTGETSEVGSAFKALHLLFKSNLPLAGAVLKFSGGRWSMAVAGSGAEKVAAILLQHGFSSIGETTLDKSEPPIAADSGEIAAAGFFPPAGASHLYSTIHALAKNSNLTCGAEFFLNGAFRAGWKGSLHPGTPHEFSGLNRWISKNGGWICYEKVPAEHWQGWSMWGEERAEWKLSAKLKRAFDPDGMMNPGRFAGRI